MYDRGHIRPMPTPGAKRIKVPDSCRLGHQSIADNLPCSVSRVQLGLNQRPWVTVLTPVTTAPCGPRYTPPPSRPSQYPLANLLIPLTPPQKKMIKNYKTPTFYIAMLCIILQTIDMYNYTHQLGRKL